MSYVMEANDRVYEGGPHWASPHIYVRWSLETEFMRADLTRLDLT
jgi:hypothetical protein